VDLKEYIKSLIRKQLEEMSTTAGVGGYSTPFAFSPNKVLKNAATKYAMKMGWKLAGGMPKKSKVIDYKELWKGKKSAMNENNNQITLQDILDKKGSLDHLKGVYLKIIPGPFTEKPKNKKYEGKGCKFLFHDRREGLIGVDLDLKDEPIGSRQKSANLYPKELVIDVERSNMRESLKKLIEQELLNEVTYSKFKKEVKHRTKSEQLHKAIREVKKKLQEIDRIVEYTSRMKQELSEDEGGISYWKATQNNIGRISEMVNQLNNKIKNLHQ
jgi:CRISPR/Cas system-associated endoribonuclease Cas2